MGIVGPRSMRPELAIAGRAKRSGDVERHSELTASANLDLVRAAYAGWERGDYSSAEWADPEIELVIADGPAPGTWRGFAGLAQGWRGFLSAWEEFRSEAIDAYRELHGERILVLAHFSARGKTSGLDLGQMQTNGASLFHLRGGKVTRLVLYFVADHALVDLGLAKEAGSPPRRPHLRSGDVFEWAHELIDQEE